MFDATGVLPEGLDGMEPSPVLALFLSTVEIESLSGFDRIRVLQSCQRLTSLFQARVFEAMASISDLMDELEPDPEIAYESAAAEIGAALRLTRWAADADLALAIDLKERLPVVWEALAAGEIDLRRARVIVKQAGGQKAVSSTPALPVPRTSGPAASDTPTPPATTHPETGRRHWESNRLEPST